jgi:hypothetical protein
MKDKENQIEEMAKVIGWDCNNKSMDYCDKVDDCDMCRATDLYNVGYRKLPKDSVVIPKEVSCYENIERAVRTFRLDGSNVDFTNEQIMALTQIFHIKERNENEIRKETAEKILKLVKEKSWCYQEDENGRAWTYSITVTQLKELAKQFGVGIKE